MEKFICMHCGNHFEGQPSDSVICPKCSWSTSVRKETETLKTSAEFPRPEFSRSVTATSETPVSRGLWAWAGGMILILLLAGISLFAFHHLKKQNEILKKIESKNAQVIAAQAPELEIAPEQREILDRAVSIPMEGPVTDQEKEILTPRFNFRSQGAQGIPTPPWNEKEFEAFLKAQQAQYRMTFEWSYHRKLAQLFKQHYLPATQAFEAKNPLKARDEWIRSLAFPVYENDIRKHRGVALTMLRPFINDTLAKIGSMNASLTGSGLYALEEKAKTSYDALADLLAKQSWEEANAKLLELKNQIAETEKLPPAANPPPLPKETALVDQDIREVLLAQVAPAQTSAPDWAALRAELAAKENVIQSHLPASLEAVSKQYESVLQLIKNKSWAEAKEELQRIEYPGELAQDAREKIKVLDQLMQVSADTEKKTGEETNLPSRQ